MDNVLITGVSGGIGKGVAERLINNGSSVIGLDVTLSDDIKSISRQYEGKLKLIECDLMEAEQLPSVIKNIVAEYGAIGGFVHCAGFDKMMPLHLTKTADIEQLWRIHALAPMVMIGAISKKKNHADNTSVVLIT